MPDRVTTPEEFKESVKVQRLNAVESDFKGHPGYWQKPSTRPGIEYDWGCKLPTKEACAALHKFHVAQNERMSRLQAAVPRETLVDQHGNRQFVDAALADGAARRNGWSHRWRAGGLRLVEGGIGGMMWRWLPGDFGGWEPTGLRCLGTPLKGTNKANRKVFQYDPDGNPWHWVGGAWKPLGL